MSDNIGYTPGTGATVAADNIGGVLHQRVKISVGADGVAADASADNPLPVTAVAELMEAIEALRFAVASLTKTIGFALPNTLGQPIMEVRQATAGNLVMNANQSGTWNIGTVTALTGQSNIGGFAANDQIPALMHLQVDGLRANITVT
ncbi:MAG: hypothetical protein KGS46_20760 [Chloroflexi bacterium]|nr:hypothetical protein [Chloroflexota bacterium]